MTSLPGFITNGHKLKPAPPTSNKKTSSRNPKLPVVTYVPAAKPSAKTAPPDVPSEELYAKLCQLYVDGGIIALRHFFDQIHPPATLSEHLSRSALHKQLRRLHVQALITADQWRMLYPIHHRTVSSQRFDAVLLVVLLKSVCRLSAPYPNGWDELPLGDDYSMAADLVRLELYRKALLVLRDREDVPMDTQQFQVYWMQISDVIKRLGGEKGIKAIGKIEKEKLDAQAQKEIVQRLHDWHENSLEANGKERAIGNVAKLRDTDHDLAKITKTNFKASKSAYKTQDMQEDEDDDGGHLEESEESGDEEEDEEATSKNNYSREAQLAREVEEEIIYEVARSLEKDILEKYADEISQNIKSDDVLPKLVQRGIISHEEKNKISLLMRNTDRMKLVIEVLAAKSGKAFDTFCDIIKFRQKGLYNKLVDTKKAPLLIGRPDEGSQVSDALKNKYKAVYSKCVPIPWYDTVYAPIHDFFVHPYITNLAGRDVKDCKLFSAYANNENPRRLLMEGTSGMGKTTFCRHLAYEWGRGNITWDDKFKMVFLIDVQMIHKKAREIEDVILEQCLPFSFKKSREEITAVLQKHQKQVLFIFDGIESQRQTQALSELYADTQRFPEAAVIATINQNFVSSLLLQNFDTRLVLMGQHHEEQEEIVRTYSRLTQKPVHVFNPLLKLLYQEAETDDALADIPQQNGTAKAASSQNSEADTQENGEEGEDDANGDNAFVLSLNPMACLCMCLVCEFETSTAHSFKTITHLMQSFTTALQKLYCKRFNLLVQRDHMSQEVHDVLHVLEQIAFNSAVSHTHIMSTETLRKQHKSKEFLNFGLLTVFLAGQRSRPIESCMFGSPLIQSFLAATHLSKMEPEDFAEYTEQLVTDPYLHNVAVFFSGIEARNKESKTLPELFRGLAERNISTMRGLSFIDSRPGTRSTKPMSAKTDTTIFSQSTFNSMAPPPDAGRLSDFQLVLECLHQCEGREDVMNTILESLPSRLFTRSKDIMSSSMIEGLCQLLGTNSKAINELDLRLDHFAHYNIHASRLLTQVLEKSTGICVLRLRWTSDSILALFLAQIFGKNSTIHTLKIYDELRLPEDGISASVWSSFRAARKGMRWIRTFAFSYCKNPEMTTSILRNIPDTLQELDLNHSRLDLVGAQELAEKIQSSPRLKVLCLQSAEFDKVEFVHIARGFKHSKTLVELNLAHTGMDQVSMKTLTEALMFNKSIRRLHLRRNALDSVSCAMFAEVLGTNKSLQEVNLRDCGINEEDKEELRGKKRRNTQVLGINPRRPASSFYKGST